MAESANRYQAGRVPSPPDEPDTPHDAPPASRQGAFIQRSLFETRTVLVFGEVTTELAHDTCAQILAVASASADPIRVIVHSQGGHVEAGDAIHDVLRFVRTPILMMGTGWVASAGAFIYVAANRDSRFATPNTRFLLHQPLGGVRGRASDIEIEAQQILSIRERHNRALAEATGQPFERIVRDTDRNHWMNAEEAVAYGLVGRIVRSVDELELGLK